jgi:hypothetical protein
MKKQVFILCLLALIGTVSAADNLFFKVVDGDFPGVNVSNAKIEICVRGDRPFTAGGGTGGGGGGGGGAGGEGDTISVSPSTASNGCLTGTTDYLGEASFNVEYRGLDQMDLWYEIQLPGYKNASGGVSMLVLGIPIPSMGSFYIKELNINLDLTQWALSKSPWLRQGLYNKCSTGGCTYASKYVNVSMQGMGNMFRLRWGDIFPACAADYSGNVDSARCAAEFLVPNLHLQSYVSLTWQMFMSIFRVELSLQGLFDWVLGIITPLFIMALIFVYEVVKTYLEFALTYLSWACLISVLVWKNVISPSALAWLIPVTVIAIFLGSIWLIGSDINLWKPLLIW